MWPCIWLLCHSCLIRTIWSCFFFFFCFFQRPNQLLASCLFICAFYYRGAWLLVSQCTLSSLLSITPRGSWTGKPFFIHHRFLFFFLLPARPLHFTIMHQMTWQRELLVLSPYDFYFQISLNMNQPVSSSFTTGNWTEWLDNFSELYR